MFLLFVSIAMLWISPWIYGQVSKHERLRQLTQKFLVILISLLVVFGILPEAIGSGGWGAVPVLIAGTLLPSLIERAWHRLAVTVHWIPLVIGLVGLALHASLDGAAFVAPSHPKGAHVHALPLAVIVHRFFEGLFIWLFLRPRFGARVATTALALISSFSLLGYWAGDVYFHSIEGDAAFGLFQALVGGSLLHLVVDQHDPGAEAMHGCPEQDDHPHRPSDHHHHHHHHHSH